MSQTGLNIFDALMLGPVEQTQTVSGSVTGEQPDVQLFGNMLDSLLNIKKSDQFPGMVNPLEDVTENNFSNILNENVSEKISDPLTLLPNPKSNNDDVNLSIEEKVDALTLIETGEQESLKLLNSNLKQPHANNSILQDVAVIETSNGQVKPENIKDFNNALAELMPLNTGSNKQIAEMINQVPVKLDSGSYEIIDAEIKDDSLVLSVVSDSKSEPIKISLPLEQLKAASSESDILSQRVNLGTQHQQKLELENLIKNLNLKELTVQNNEDLIKTEQSGLNSNKNKIVNIEITAENSGQIQLIKGKLLKSSVRATQKNHQIVANNNLSGEEADLQDIQRVVGSAKSETAFNKQFMTKNQNFGREQLLNLTNKQTQNVVSEFSQPLNSEVIPANTTDIESLKELNNTTSSKNETIPVKYNLPDDIRTALKPNGKSINILIDPENLGPARLKLVMNNQTLRAELIVNSSHAKSVVENSLSQLIEQLNRSDIKVEFIDVNVNSENNQEQFAHRQPQWSRKSFSNNSGNLNDDSLAYLPNDEISGIAQGSYVSSEGVNVLA